MSDWLLSSKIDIDGVSKIIFVRAGVTQLDIKNDVYSSWINWVNLNDNLKYLPALRYTGFDPIGSGVYTGDTYFLINGWKLSLDFKVVKVSGVLYSDDYSTAYYTPEIVAQYPVTVSSVVNTVSTSGAGGASASDIWSYSNRGLSTPIPTTTEIADSVWGHSFVSKILTVAKFLGLK